MDFGADDDGDDIRPLATNPGGVVDPEDLVGRENEVERLVRSVLTGGGAVLGDRRMGKTSVLRKVEHQLESVGHVVIRVSAETDDPAKFAALLGDKLRSHGRLEHAWARWEKELGGEVSINTGLFGIKLVGRARSGGRTPREADLFELCADVAGATGPYRMIFILDEITVLVGALGRSRPGAAEEFMRSLRQPRQEIDGVAMIVAGSIGLHHVLPDLAAVNDLDKVGIGPLTKPEAVYLTRRLLRGASIATQHEREIAAVLAEQASCIPYYLNVFVQRLVEGGHSEPTRQDIVTMVEDALTDPADPLDIRHYDSRILGYYGVDAALVRAMLDAYAATPHPSTFQEVEGRLAAVDLESRPDRDSLLSLLPRLEADHYLVREGATDRFATELLRRAWVSLRRLA